MKIHVCIIEDEEQYSSLLKEMLRKWQDENSVVLSISLFSSGKDFLAGKEPCFDLIFLDIQLGGCSGIEIARRMREQGYEGEIVFLTAYQEYVFEGYNVRALNYFLKPIRYEQLDSCMQYVTRRLSASCFICRHYGDMTTSSNQYTEIHTAGSVYRQAEPLKRVAARLPVQFIQCHRTAVVNIDHVEKLAGSTVCLDSGETEHRLSRQRGDAPCQQDLPGQRACALPEGADRDGAGLKLRAEFQPALRIYVSDSFVRIYFHFLRSTSEVRKSLLFNIVFTGCSLFLRIRSSMFCLVQFSLSAASAVEITSCSM